MSQSDALVDVLTPTALVLRRYAFNESCFWVDESPLQPRRPLSPLHSVLGLQQIFDCHGDADSD